MWWRRRRRELLCRELVELAGAYLDDVLAPADRARVEAHLAGCDDCGAYVAQLRATLAALGALGPDDAEPPGLEALVAAFRARHAGR
jgi:anti-sigma factor RsiW